MFIAIGFMVMGGIVGFLQRKKKFSNTSNVITGLIWLLLFILGVEVGANPRIIAGLATLGVEALITTIAAVLGSAVAALLLWRFINKNKKNIHER